MHVEVLFTGKLSEERMFGCACAVTLLEHKPELVAVYDSPIGQLQDVAPCPDKVVDAVQQLMAPLISSTLTTVVVFAPLGLLSGVAGQFFRALSMTLSVADRV